MYFDPLLERQLHESVIAAQAIDSRLSSALRMGDKKAVLELRALSEFALTAVGVAAIIAYDCSAVDQARAKFEAVKERARKASSKPKGKRA